jgi:ribonuclease HI
MAKKHFYAVFKGRKPGIYTRWSGPDGAEAQVKGYPGAVFQSFATREEADYYLKHGGQALPPAPALLPEAVHSREAEPAKKPAAPTAHQADLAAGKTVIFTDGASTGNPGPGGYGIVMLYGEARKELSGGFRCTTNNRMEMTAVIVALQALTRPAQVVLYSDSTYVVNAIEKGWARRWQANDWLRAPDSTGVRRRAENVDLWSQLLDLLDRHSVEFRWVRGHASSPENERCDRLAVQAAHRPKLPADPGFLGRC